MIACPLLSKIQISKIVDGPQYRRGTQSRRDSKRVQSHLEPGPDLGSAHGSKIPKITAVVIANVFVTGKGPSTTCYERADPEFANVSRGCKQAQYAYGAASRAARNETRSGIERRGKQQ